MVSFGLHPVQKLRIQLGDQRRKLRIKGGDGRGFRLALGQRQAKAPDLFAFFLAEVVEILGEARDHVGLGEQHINREAHPQLFAQFRQAALHRAGMGLLRHLILQRQVGQRNRNHRPVDRLPNAVLFQQIEKAEPSRIIRIRIAFLRGIAPRRINQHSVIGEPPIAVAGAADPANRFFAKLIRQREL